MEKFWSDDFDMDLLKVVPNVIEDVGEYAERRLWTLGHLTEGRLNHPTVWNTHGAYVWLDKPNLPRDEHGWANIGGCVTNDKEIECTWLELLRDQWPHSYDFVLLPSRTLFPAAPRTSFDCIMYHLRAWQLDDASNEKAQMRARLWVVNATRRLKTVVSDG